MAEASRMKSDTDLGGSAPGFPITRWSIVRGTGSPDLAVRKQAQETLIAGYWKAVYKYIRRRWNIANEDAKDLTQAFFAEATQKSFFDRFDPTKARFRTFLRACVEGFVNKEHRSASRLKRGGGLEKVSLDFAGADQEFECQLAAPALTLDDFFRQEWLRAVFAAALEDLRCQCAAADKTLHFKVFERYDLESEEARAGLTYALLAKELGLSTAQVTNYLAFTRGRFRQLVLDRLRATTGSAEEFEVEVRNLFGGKPV
jgi:RNA polymerase sigma factor (sigma-70 family)